MPTNTEWATLGTYLGGSTVAGGKLKETGTPNWLSPNTDATNESDFTGLPTGFGGYMGGFGGQGEVGNFWSATDDGNPCRCNEYGRTWSLAG